MHPLFRPYKKLIPPPIFSIVMVFVFICIGSQTIIRGWSNTGRGNYERIITFSSNPIEFAFWVLMPFLFAIASAVLAYLAYTKSRNDDANDQKTLVKPSVEGVSDKNGKQKKIAVRLINLGWILLFSFLFCLIDQLKIVSHEFAKQAAPPTFAGIFFLCFLYSVITEEIIPRNIPAKKAEYPVLYYVSTTFWLLAAIVVLIW